MAAAESETLTSAAQRLGITQSAVSQAIAQLEGLVATELMVRRSRPIQLTPAGEVLKEHADQLLIITKRMLQDVAVAAAACVLSTLIPAGTSRLAAPLGRPITTIRESCSS